MLGWALNGLRRRLDQRGSRMVRPESDTRRISAKSTTRFAVESGLCPGANVSAFFAFVTLGTLLTGILDSHLWVIIYVDRAKDPYSITYFATLWSVQAGVAALVYPIVIAFVALLLGRSSSAKATLHIYLHDSAALLAGLSALMLVAEMGVQYLGLPYVGKTTTNAWLALDAIWFIVNVGLTTYFIFRTFEFVQPTHRFEIIRKYAVSVAWPREVRFHLARHFLAAAVGEGLLPGPNYGDAKGLEPSVLPGNIGMKLGDAAVTCSHGNRRQLCDIYFRSLAWATNSWLARAKKTIAKPPTNPVGGGLGTDAVIAYPVDPFETYEGTTTLCSIQGDTKLKPVQTLPVCLLGSGAPETLGRRYPLTIFCKTCKRKQSPP